MAWAQLLIKLLVHLVELAVQVKRRDENEKRQERLQQAKSNPGDYLRQFGRVRHVADEPKDAVRGDTTGVDGNDRDR
jgi:hypothetical protein